MTKRAAIIGGGISGLTTAFLLAGRGVDITVFESSNRSGGAIETKVADGFLYECGPNSTLASRPLIDLIDSLDLRGEIAQPNPNAKNRFIVRGGRLVKLPSRILQIFGTEAFSGRGKLRLLQEPLVGRGFDANESVAQFFGRRFGRELVDYAVDPFVSGIYAGDPKKLSMRLAFARVRDLEQNFGSLAVGALLSKKKKSEKLPAGVPRSITFKHGMQTLTDALAARVGERLRLGVKADAVKADVGQDKGYVVQSNGGEEHFDAVVFAVQAFAASSLASHLDRAGDDAQTLGSAEYAPVCVVFSAFAAADVGATPNGFGFLVPGVEHRQILGSLWTSSVFENRAPRGYHLFTTFVGGSRNAALSFLDDEKVKKIVFAELADLMKLSGAPVFTEIKRWPRAIPQYNVGYERIYNAADNIANANAGAFFCSNFLGGISVSDCVRNAEATAGRVADYLQI